MNNHEQQDALLRELDFIRVSIMLKPDQADYLHSIDADNMSKAVRIVIDREMNHTKREKLERYLLLVLVFSIFILGLLQIILW